MYQVLRNSGRQCSHSFALCLLMFRSYGFDVHCWSWSLTCFFASKGWAPAMFGSEVADGVWEELHILFRAFAGLSLLHAHFLLQPFVHAALAMPAALLGFLGCSPSFGVISLAKSSCSVYLCWLLCPLPSRRSAGYTVGFSLVGLWDFLHAPFLGLYPFQVSHGRVSRGISCPV